MAPARQERLPSTRSRFLDIAEELMQTRGFNGFSYADVASALNITTPSLHYHFATKADLGEAIVKGYSERFFKSLDLIDKRSSDAPARLQAYADLFTAVLRKDRFCLCGMLSAEYNTLPEAMREGVREFFERNESWLIRTLEEGQRAGQIRLAGSPVDTARSIVSGLEGAMLLSRPYRDLARFKSTSQRLISSLVLDSGGI